MTGPDARAVLLSRLRALARAAEHETPMSHGETRRAFATLAEGVAEGLCCATGGIVKGPTMLVGERVGSCVLPPTVLRDVDGKVVALLRHVLARPGSTDVRDRAEVFLAEHGLDRGPLLAVEGIAPPAPPTAVTLSDAAPLSERSDAIARGLDGRGPAAPKPCIDADPRGPCVFGALAPNATDLAVVPGHSHQAVRDGLVARANNAAPADNPYTGSRGIAGARRLWWERARSGSVTA